MSTLRVNTLQNAAGTGQPAMSGAAKAWVNFNGAGTIAIRASFNVTSITDNGVGDYTVNFTTTLADADYAVVSTIGQTTITLGGGAAAVCMPKTYSASSIRILTGYGNSMTANDWDQNNVAIFD
jgi:hypothetical protein